MPRRRRVRALGGRGARPRAPEGRRRRADSWAVDAHKWLNVPYDGALAIVADPAPLNAAMALTAAYLTDAGERERNGADWAPEASPRTGVPDLGGAAALGRRGVAELVERDCALAARIAGRLAGEPGVAILNDVVLNQALARFGDDDAATESVIARVQQDGTCWLGGTGLARHGGDGISVSGWQTTEADAERARTRSRRPGASAARVRGHADRGSARARLRRGLRAGRGDRAAAARGRRARHDRRPQRRARRGAAGELGERAGSSAAT